MASFSSVFAVLIVLSCLSTTALPLSDEESHRDLNTALRILYGHRSRDHDWSSQYVWILVGFLLGSGLILILLIWLRKYTEHGGTGHGADAEIELGTPAAMPSSIPLSTGLTLTDIRALPSAMYPLPSSVQYVCPICLEDFSTEAEITVLSCRHYYHPLCIESALLLRPTCPYCNQIVSI